MKTKGFTLVELLVVIAILAILATVSVVGYTQYINNANVAVIKEDLVQVRTALMAADALPENAMDLSDGEIDDADVAAVNTLIGTLNAQLKGTIATATAGATTITYTVEGSTLTGTLNLATGEITVQ